MVDGGVDLRGVDSAVGQALEGLEDDLLHLLRVFGGDSLQACAEDRLFVVVVESGPVSQRAAQARVDERFAQRRARVGQQDLGQHLHGQRAERIRAGNGDPRGECLRLASVVFASRGRKCLDARRGRLESLHVPDRRVDLEALEPSQGVAFDHLQRGFERQVAVAVEARVARVVVALVEPPQLVPRKVGYVLRIPARHVRVGQAGEKGLADRAVDRGSGRGECPLHLIEDHALVAKSSPCVFGVLELETDALLLERVLGQTREERRVEVNAEEIREVVRVARAEQVHGPVRTGEGVHEGGE